MKIVRISLKQGPRFAIIDPETDRYAVIAGDPLYTEIQLSGESYDRSEVQVLAPMLPRSKVLCLAGDYEENICAATSGFANLSAYIKPNTAVSGQNTPITLPEFASSAVSCPQLAVIISRPCKNISAAQAPQAIFGITLLNSIYLPDLAPTNPAAAYGFDTSCPLGSLIETAPVSGNLRVERNHNGTIESREILVQLDDIYQMVATSSQFATFLPGDIVGLGNLLPALELAAGDEIEITASGLGKLRNPVVFA